MYQTYYESGALYSETSSNISWIGSIQSFCVLLVGAFVGPIYDRGHLRALLIVGTFFMVVGMGDSLHICAASDSSTTRTYDAITLHGILAVYPCTGFHDRNRRRMPLCAFCGHITDLFHYQNRIGHWAWRCWQLDGWYHISHHVLPPDRPSKLSTMLILQSPCTGKSF